MTLDYEEHLYKPGWQVVTRASKLRWTELDKNRYNSDPYKLSIKRCIPLRKKLYMLFGDMILLVLKIGGWMSVFKASTAFKISPCVSFSHPSS